MSVRLTRPGDEAAVAAASRLFLTDGHFDPSPFLDRPDACLFLAEESGQVVGWVYGHELVHPDGERTMLLYSLDVVESAQKRGHGRTLVEAFVDHARSSGCTEVWVLTEDTNAAALATYASAGGTRETMPAVMFTWHLAPGRHSG